MERSKILAGIHEIFEEILPKYDPAPVTEDTLVVNISAEVDSLTVNELILGMEDSFELDEIPQGTITAETKISDLIDLVVAAQS